KHAQEAELLVTTFSLDLITGQQVKSVSEALQTLEKTIFDGATNLDQLDELLDPSCELCIAFTDGQHTIGPDITPSTTYSIPLYIINTSPSCNSQLLTHVATKSGGAFYDGYTLSHERIVNVITQPVLIFLTCDYEPEQLEEIYPNEPVVIDTNNGYFHIYGKLKPNINVAEMTCIFKNGNQTNNSTFTIPITIHPSPSDTKVNDKENVIAHLWVKQKLSCMSAFPEIFSDQLKQLAIDWKIVTPETSLIVLETSQQYIKHKIRPHEKLTQMVKDYENEVKRQEEATEHDKQAKIEIVKKMWKLRRDWYEKNHALVNSERKYLLKYSSTNARSQSRPPSESRMYSGSIFSSKESLGPPPEHSYARSSPAPASSRSAPPPAYKSIAPLPPGMCVPPPSPSQKLSVAPPPPPTSESVAPPSGFGGPIPLYANSAPRDKVQEKESKKESAVSGRQSPTNGEVMPQREAINTSSISVENFDSTWYLGRIKEANDPYRTYLSLRNNHSTSPAFFLDVADYFLSSKSKQNQGLTILTNILELELDSEQLLRIVSYRLDQSKRYLESEYLFEKVLKMRPDQPQSYRDLALIKEKLNKLTEAADLLNQVVYKRWDKRFEEIEVTALIELNHLLTKDSSLYVCDEYFRYKMDLDLRISMAWDTNDTDVDLHVYEGVANGQTACYSRRDTTIGGHVSKDFRQGYGPEEYMLKVAPSGTYKVMINYFKNHQKSLSGGTTVLLTFFTNYMRPNEKSETVTVRLTSIASMLEVCSIKV
ncbi:YfaP, partial [Acrasis kona]